MVPALVSEIIGNLKVREARKKRAASEERPHIRERFNMVFMDWSEYFEWCAGGEVDGRTSFKGADVGATKDDVNAELGQAISPTLQLKSGGVPAILFFGTSDPLIEQGREFIAKAKEVGVRAELKSAPDQKHGYFNRSPWQERTLYEVDEFLASLGYLAGPPKLTKPE